MEDNLSTHNGGNKTQDMYLRRRAVHSEFLSALKFSKWSTPNKFDFGGGVVSIL